MEPEEMNKFEEAGRIASQVRKFAQGIIKEGAQILRIAESIENKIISLGGSLAFPVNISINELAAHYVPKYNDTIVLKKGDLVKIDFGVHVDGYPVDTAFSVSVGEDEENNRLIEAAQAAFDAAFLKVKPGAAVSDIGATIESAAQKYRVKTIKNLTGHGLERFDLHSEPGIPNFASQSHNVLEDATAIAIEPFVTLGNGFVAETENCEVFQLIESGTIRNKEVMKFIESEFNTFPFAKRWLIKKFGVMKTNLALREAVSRGFVRGFKTLKETSGSKVAQVEHTILVLKNSKIITI